MASFSSGITASRKAVVFICFTISEQIHYLGVIISLVKPVIIQSGDVLDHNRILDATNEVMVHDLHTDNVFLKVYWWEENARLGVNLFHQTVAHKVI